MTIHTTAAGRDGLECDEWATTPATADSGGGDDDFGWLLPADTDPR